ncbi:zinc ABC transporter substrate-binding protein [Desulfovibrio mangrovi]|uniref:metal ABC transporter solute-binding protein, Zn/Mn family n=1 Tax=Desulfovibrio mangrovi TaxID=2976983 RepID=UPI0022453979|nr:zinc ABC transporter substrate-binding protein [Desulfovibrio mangrovi]UZP68648.1 zinc ABC transporter substrate-binding protein [Desulfovibrio mangrovi]
MDRRTHSPRSALRILFIATMLIALPALVQAKVPVVVSIVPQQFFVERIGGEFVDVSVMVQPGASPATYEPKPRQMAALSGATLYFAIGVPFENAWLPRIQAANPAMKIVYMDKGVHKLPMAEHHHENKAGHEEHKQSMNDEQGGLDPHVWLSPMLMKHMGITIRKELSKADPAHAAIFRTNFAELEKEIDALDRELMDVFAPIPQEKRIFMVFHPSWGYFAMNYSLKQVPIEYEGKEPTPRILKELMEEAAGMNVRTIFVQPQFARKSAEAIAAHINGSVVVADPLAYDWFANLREVARNLAVSFNQ